MPDHTLADFLEAIRADPDCDTRRGAFADFLDESGDPWWAWFVRWSIKNPEPKAFTVRTYSGPESVVVYRWAYVFDPLHHLPRGVTGFVRRFLPPPGDAFPPNTGFIRRAVFRRGLLESMSVPNAWWLEHGDVACARTAGLSVTVPDTFPWQERDREISLVGDPTHRTFHEWDIHWFSPEGFHDNLLRLRWPTATFRVAPTGR